VAVPGLNITSSRRDAPFDNALYNFGASILQASMWAHRRFNPTDQRRRIL
jgi:hypothetical protein